jgi:hypothetical protein
MKKKSAKFVQAKVLCDTAADAVPPCHQVLIDVRFSAAEFPKGQDGTPWLDVSGTKWTRSSQLLFENIRVDTTVQETQE